MSAPLRIEKVVTKGAFALDDGTWDVDNNIWLVGDDTDVLIVDAAHEAQPIIDAVGGRNVTAVICTPRSQRPRDRCARTGRAVALPGAAAPR